MVRWRPLLSLLLVACSKAGPPSALAPTVARIDGLAVAPGGLSLGDVGPVVHTNLHNLQRVCWEPVKSAGMATSASLSIELLIAPGGEVSNAKVTSTPPLPRLDSCLDPRLVALRFPAHAAPTTATFRIEFALAAAPSTPPASAAPAPPPGASGPGP